METQTNGKTPQQEPDQRAVSTLDSLLATAKNDKDKHEILGRVGKGLVRRINEGERRLSSAVLNGDFEGARQLNREIDEMNALGWHICKHPVLVSGLAETLVKSLIEALQTGKIGIGAVEVEVDEKAASRHGLSFL